MKSKLLIHPEELDRIWIEKMAAARIDVLGIHPRGGSDAARTAAELVALCRDDSFREKIDLARARGLEIEYEMHAIGYLLPRELYGVHPEYFRMDDEGNRRCDYNMCASSEEALRLVAERAGELAEALYGSSDCFYFWMDDTRGACCRCKGCRALTPSDQQQAVLNAILGGIRRKRPGASVAYLAYYDTLEPPTAVGADEGIFLEYAPLFKYTGASEENLARERNALAPLLAHFGTKGSTVLEYWYDNSMFSRWRLPPVRFTLDAVAMERDIKEYVDMGFENISSFACFLGESYRQLWGDTYVGDITKILESI